MNEKVTVSITTEALTSLESIVQDTAIADSTIEGLCQNKITNLFMYKYPQFGDTSSIFGMLFHHEAFNKSFQMVVEISNVECVITAIIENNEDFSNESMINANIEFTLEQGYSFSNEMMSKLNHLPVYEKQELILQTMNNWEVYLDFLIDRYEYPFTIKSIEQNSNRVYTITLFEEERVESIEFTKGMSIFIQEGFQFKEIGSISFENSSSPFIEVSSDINLLDWKNREVYIFEEENLKDIKKMKSELAILINKENERPTLSNPLLNSFYEVEHDFSGITSRKEDYENGVKSLFLNNELDEYYSEVLLSSSSIEKEISNFTL